MDEKTNTFQEEMRITGEPLVTTVKKLLHEGNVRHIVIKNQDGRILVEIPLTLGIVVALFAPVIAVIGVIGVFVEDLVIVMERVEPFEDEDSAEFAPEVIEVEEAIPA